MASLLLIALSGCAPGPIDAPYGSELIMPTDISFSMDGGLASPGDGYGHLFITDYYVLHDDPQNNTAAMNGIKVEVMSGWSGAYVIPEEAVTIVTSYEETCAGAAVDDSCHIYFDDENEFWVEFAGDYEDIGDFRPTYYSGPTDNNGRLRAYLFVDSVPLDSSGTPATIPVYVTITGVAESLTLTPLSDDSTSR